MYIYVFPDQGSNLYPLKWKYSVVTTGPPWKSQNQKKKFFRTVTSIYSYYKVLKLPVVSYSLDYTVHGILQARILSLLEGLFPTQGHWGRILY